MKKFKSLRELKEKSEQVMENQEEIYNTERCLQNDIAHIELGARKAIEDLNGCPETEIVENMLDKTDFEVKKQIKAILKDLEDNESCRQEICETAMEYRKSFQNTIDFGYSELEFIKQNQKVVDEIIDILTRSGLCNQVFEENQRELYGMLDNKMTRRKDTKTGERGLNIMLEKIIRDCRFNGMTEEDMLSYIPHNWKMLKETYKDDGKL